MNHDGKDFNKNIVKSQLHERYQNFSFSSPPHHDITTTTSHLSYFFGQFSSDATEGLSRTLLSSPLKAVPTKEEGK